MATAQVPPGRPRLMFAIDQLSVTAGAGPASALSPRPRSPVSSLPLPLLLVIFLGAAGVIWVAGIRLSDQTDVLATRLHLGAALGGLILLAIATNLPEIAITVSAGVSGNIGVAVGNI